MGRLTHAAAENSSSILGGIKYWPDPCLTTSGLSLRSSPLHSTLSYPNLGKEPAKVPLVTAQELIDAGVHYGHQASRWNPKMKPFIHGKRHKIHVINLEETIRGLYQATHFVRSLAATGAQIMFLGTKKQIRPVVEAEAQKCQMPSVTERWIGGTLTNFATVRERLTRLVELEQLETTGGIEKYKKKDQSMIRRDIKRSRRNLDGVRDLHG